MIDTSGNNIKVNARISSLATRNGTEFMHKFDMDVASLWKINLSLTDYKIIRHLAGY